VRGVELAVAEVNAAGGLNGGHRVEALVRDSGTTMAQGLAAANEVVDGGAVAIIGDGGSASSLAIYRMVTGPMQIPQISGSATSTSLTDANETLLMSERYFFRTAPPDSYQAQVVDRIATNNASCSRLAVLYQDDDYGGPLGTAIGDLFAMHGMVTARVSFTPAQASYASEVSMASMGSPDCVALIAYPTDAGIVLRNWRDASLPAVQWIGTDGLFSQDFINEAGSDALVQNFYGASPLTTPDTPEFADFQARYHAAYGHDAENFVANYYDAAALVLLAIERLDPGMTGPGIRDSIRAIGMPLASPTLERAAGLRQALAVLPEMRNIDYVGASGPITFDANGDTVAPYEIWQITGTPATFHEVAVVQATDLTP
jgi:ABC-type branched-subunit amino acid transport system substrate-binding protein